MGSQLIDMKGKKIGRLTVIKYLGNSFWECRCDCGTVTKATGGNLRLGRQFSCGCQGRENIQRMKDIAWNNSRRRRSQR